MPEYISPERSWQVRIKQAARQADGTLKEGRIEGGGVWVGERWVLTCAHVVKSRTNTVYVEFTFAGGSPITAHVDKNGWVSKDEGDLALLKLDADPPAVAKPAPLRFGRNAKGHHCEAYGYPAKNDEGVLSLTKVDGIAQGSWIQLTSEVAHGHRIQKGFSGTGLFDTAINAVIGLVVAAEQETGVKVSYAISVDRIKKAFPQIEPWLGWRLSQDPQMRKVWLPYERAIRENKGWRLIGRRAVLENIIKWMQSPSEIGGIQLITGPTGTGKTSILAWLCALSDSYINTLVSAQSSPTSDDACTMPGLGKISAAISLSGKDMGDVIEALASILEIPIPIGASPEELFVAVEDSAQRHNLNNPLCVLIDDFDKAKAPFEIANRLLLPLAHDHNFKILIATRRGLKNEYINMLGRRSIAYHLDEAPWYDHQNFIHYVAACLRGDFNTNSSSGYQYEHDACAKVAAAIAKASAGNYMHAREIAYRCADEPVIDINDPNWDIFNNPRMLARRFLFKNFSIIEKQYRRTYPILVRLLRDVDSERLQEAVLCFNTNLTEDYPTQYETLAYALLHSQDLENAHRAINIVFPDKHTLAQQLTELIIPFVWMNDDCAQYVYNLVINQDAWRAAAIQSKDLYVRELIIKRATAEESDGKEWVQLHLVGEANNPEELLNCVRQELRGSPEKQLDDTMQDDNGLRRAMKYQSHLLWLPANICDIEMLAPLRKIFPDLSLSIYAMEPDIPARRGLNFVTFIRLPSNPSEDDIVYVHSRLIKQHAIPTQGD